MAARIKVYIGVLILLAAIWLYLGFIDFRFTHPDMTETRAFMEQGWELLSALFIMLLGVGIIALGVAEDEDL